MKIYHLDDKLCLKDSAVALGEFDALHKGHMEIIGKTVSYARKNDLLSLVIMFENNPVNFISGKNVLPVNTLKKRYEIIESLGVDAVISLSFDKNIMDMSHNDFFEDIICKKANARYLSVGFNYRFGNGGKGDIGFLSKACGKKGITLNVTQEIKVLGDTVSSTRIRNLLEDGEIEDANELLGRPFSIEGVIVKGNQLGSTLFGFPTANFKLPEDMIIPKYGVYIVEAELLGKRYRAFTNIGERPTVNKKEAVIETHIFDEKFGPLYGEEIKIYFYKYIRAVVAFNSPEELLERLKKDKEIAIEYFKGV